MRGLAKRISLVFIGTVVLCGGLSIKDDFSNILKRAAMVATVLTMPQGGLMSLEQMVDPNFEETPTQIPNITSISPPVSSSESETMSASEEEQHSQPQTSSTLEASSHSLDSPSPNIPEKYKGKIIAENMAGEKNKGLVEYKSAFIKNYTSMSPERILQKLQNQNTVKLSKTDKPQVLIMHTHATESYTPNSGNYYDMRYNWRTTDNNNNMVAVGAVMAEQFENAGIGVIHDTTQHDYPSYNGAYDKSENTVKDYLKKYPSIKIVFDVHRDAIERKEGLIVKPMVEIEGKNAAQVMIISCVDDGKIGIPNWEQNFKFASNLDSHIQKIYPQLTRPIFLSYRKYNQHLTTGSLLLEFGSHASTLEEAKYSAELMGKAIASFLLEQE